MKTLRNLLALVFTASTCCRSFAGAILMVHGHIDNPSLWVVQGNALAKASGGTRFYDSTHYYPGMMPAGGFQANGIYGVSYYQASLASGQFEPPISPVLVGSTEIAPDDSNFTPFLYNQSDSLAARLAQTINTAYLQTGQKVTLVCHSMGGLVAEAAIAYFGCTNKVDKLITIGSPLRGFPADFRVPAEIIVNQSGVGLAYARESLQMSEGVKYGGSALSVYLENRYKQDKPPSLTAVNIVGTLNPLPDNVLGGPSDGVVRAEDARFRDPLLSTVYELPLTHMQRIAEVWSAPEDALCLSDRTTQILEKEALGLDPLPRLPASLSFNYDTGRVRVALRNDGGLPLTITSVNGQFDFLNPTNSTLSRVANDQLTGLVGQTLQPGQFLIADGAAMARGEKASVRLTLTVNGQQLPPGEASFIANIQAPEIELSLRYDFLNSVLQNEWQTKPIGSVKAFALNASYRLEGQANYDAVSNRLKGSLTANFYGVVTGTVAIASSNLFYSESFPFDLDLGTKTFTGLGNDVLGKIPMEIADAASSQLRSLYRTHLLSLVTNPGPFVVEGNFSALAGLKLDRPVLQFDSEAQGVRLNFGATLILGFADFERSRQLQIPMQATCSAVFLNKPEGLVMKPRLEKLSLAGMALGENYRLLINRGIEANELVVVPSDFTASINGGLKDAMEQQLGANAFPKNYGFFDDVVIAIEPRESSIRILMDFYDDASTTGQNFYPGVSQNEVSIQDRLLNQLLERSVDYVNRALTRSGRNTKRIDKEIPIPGTSLYFDYPVLGPISIGVGFDGLKIYFDKVQLTFQPDFFRKFRAVFSGPNNRVHLDVPVDADFYLQIRSYFATRIGIPGPFGSFFGYTKRWEKKSLRIYSKEKLAVNLDANIYPYVRNVGGQTSVGVNFPPRELDINTDVFRSDPIAGAMGKFVVEPLFNLAKDDPRSFALLGAAAGGLIGYFAPDVLAGGAGAAASAALNNSTNPPFAPVEDGETRFEIKFGSAPAGDPILTGVGFLGGAYAGYKIGEDLKDDFDPKQIETTVDLPANIQLKDLTINSGAARLGLDVAPAYGRIYVDRMVGLDATNGIVRLSRDDFAFSSFDGGPFSLIYAGGGEQSVFSTAWVKKSVSKVRMHLRYEAIYLHRYNTNTYPDYTLQQLGAASGMFTTPADYTYNPETDSASFTVEVPLFEGQTSLQQFRLKVPGVGEKTIPILVGRDTAPILINAPFAAYSGVTSNVTVSGGTLVYQNENSDIPGFVLEELKVLKLTGASGLTDLKPLGVMTTNVFGPAETRTPRLHGAQFTWTGNLGAQQYPEGSYAALVTIRETALNRKGSLFIPFIIDRTPPALQTWTVTTNFPVMSRLQDIGLVWRMTDAYSATLRDVALTYQKQGGLIVTGANFTTPGTVMIPGQRRLDFSVDMSTVPDGVEDVYTLQFQAKDVPGNQGASSHLTFLVDTRPPTLSQSFIYPAGGVWLNQSNRIMTARLLCPEPVTARILLRDVARNSTNDWYVQSVPLTNGSGLHQALWAVELPGEDSDEGLLEGVVGDGQHQLSVELVDRGGNTNTTPYVNLRTFNIDRRPPVMSFAAQQTFIPAGRTVFPLSLNTNEFESGDFISSISLVDLRNFTATNTVASATIRTWTGGQIAGLLASGISLDKGVLNIGAPGTFLDPGYYGVEVIAYDQAGNESRITTQFGYQLMLPHVEFFGFPVVSGIVPVLGIAVDPNPADSFGFARREVYWAWGGNVAAPTNLNVINPAVWQKSGLYVLPPRGNAFANEPNKSAEMLSEGILAYWNTTAAALTLDGDSQASISAAGIVNSDVTVLLVVRDQNGQAWSATTKVHVDNRQTDLGQVNLPGVVALGSTVNNKTLSVDAALLRDAPILQMVVLDSQGNAVYRTTRPNVESRNNLFGRPDYSLENDFGYFVWYDEVTHQLKVRCVSPDRNNQEALLNKGHTFYFSIAGDFSTNDVSYFQLAAEEIPDGETIDTDTNGFTRIAFALHVPPGTEKGVAVNYSGGTLDITPLGIDDYLEVLYEDVTKIAKLYWRADDAGSVIPDYLGWESVRNLVGLEGDVMTNASVELPNQRAVANHSGVLGHIFVGRSRTEPIAPLNLSLTSGSVQPDLTLNWDLRLPNGSLANPGQYNAYLYTVDPDARRFHGARSTFTLTSADVPFLVTSLNLSTTNAFNPTANGGIVLNFNSTRSATNVSVYVRNAQGQPVATIANGQMLDGRNSTSNPHQTWWDGFIDGAPAPNGNYRFDLNFVVDGVTNNYLSDFFSVSYPTNAPRESDWGLLIQPIAFDPDNRDRIIGEPGQFTADSRAWVTLEFDAKQADGTVRSAEKQVGLAYQGGAFVSVPTATNMTPFTFIPVSSLFGDAIQRIEGLKVKFNDRVVDAFPPIDLTNNVVASIPSRSGQFQFTVLTNGPKALRLQAILRLQLRQWTNDLFAVLTEQNRLFDPQEVREFVAEIEFREKPGTNGVLQSLPWNFRHTEQLWGYQLNPMGTLVASFGPALLDELVGIEIRDRNGLQILARFNSLQIKSNGTSTVEQLFRITAFTNNAPEISADFVLETSLSELQAKALSLGVPVSIGYAGVNASLVITNGNLIADKFDPFPTRYYHAEGQLFDTKNGNLKYDNVKAYSGDSGLVQEVGFADSKIAGHIPFEYSLRPVHSGNNGQQTIQIHPWVPFSFRQNATTNATWFMELNQSNLFFGMSVSGAGDVDGDGFDDVVAGVPYYDGIYLGEGGAHVFLGDASGLATNRIGGVTEYWLARPSLPGHFGQSVKGAGDVNGDGKADVIVGAPSHNTGYVYVYYDWANFTRWTAGGDQANEGFGGSVSGAGDINGDGFDDIIIGASGYSNYLGRAVVFLGGTNGLSLNPAWVVKGSQPSGLYGTSVSGAGDVNGDDIDDVIVGTSNYSNVEQGEGGAFVYLGTTNGLTTNAVWTAEGNQAYASFGSSVSTAGDVNGDGYDDVIVGAPYYSNGQSSEGAAFVYLGGPNGLNATPFWFAEANQESAYFGTSVSTAGDVNGDGYDDVIVGAPYYSNGQTNEGRIYLYLGGLNGLSSTPYKTEESDQAFSQFGHSVSSAGDVNGDGYDDVVVGAHWYSNGQSYEGRTYVFYGPRLTTYLNGWVHAGSGGETSLGVVSSNAIVINMLSNPALNVLVTNVFDPVSQSQKVIAKYVSSPSGHTTNAPWPISADSAQQWIAANSTSKAHLPNADSLFLNGTTNDVGAQYLVNPKFAATTNDMFIATTPDAYDTVVTNGLIDYTFVADDPDYPATDQYKSSRSANPNQPLAVGPTVWELVASALQPYTNGLPAVQTSSEVRPMVVITNIVLKPDTNFPALNPAVLDLQFTIPIENGGENTFVESSFDHEANDYFRNWSLANDPNLTAAAEIEPENVQVSLVLSNFQYQSTLGIASETNNTVLLNIPSLGLKPGLTVNTNSGVNSELDNSAFLGYQSATLGLRIGRSSLYSDAGEVESMQWINLDISTNRTYAVRSSRYQCYLTPVRSGANNSILGFQLGIELDPPVEYSVRKPLRRGNKVALPLRVIDRETFWQVDQGEFIANLFKEVGIENPTNNQFGYIIDSELGYSQTGVSRILATDSNYYARANALFWKNSNGRIVPNPRIILSNLTVTLKDPSGQEESAVFERQRYVTPVTNEYFHDLYLAETDLENFSWKAKIRPQAKEHAYIKVFGSVGGEWTLSYRKKESGQLSGILPADSGALTWTTIANGTGRGQNQFLTYWDITELNGPHVVRLESTESPDNAYIKPEVKYLEVMLGQHLPGRDNPIFSPAGQAQTMSLYSMHGRTELVSAKEDRANEDLFFTVNPIKIEEKPFSLSPDGTIPLGERVQVLPHTDYNPFSVNFYIDQQEYALYDQFRLYHQLEEGPLAQIASLPPSVRPKYTLIQGYVEHTSIVGFLPNPSLRYCTLNVPQLSQDGIIRAAGSVDLFGTDSNGVKNEDLTVAIVVSPTDDFYDGQVKARLTTGSSGEFPIAGETSQADIPTGWTASSSIQTFHVFAVVVNTNDNWLTLNRQLTNTDVGQHLFNVSKATVTMTTNINGSLVVTNSSGLPIFSPNGDGVLDTVQCHINFQRGGLAELEFLNDLGQSVHRQNVTLGTNGTASFIWDGNITGQGALTVAPDGQYLVIAKYAGGVESSDTAVALVEVRAFSKYFGLLNSAGVTNTTGDWRPLFTHTTYTNNPVFTNDTIHIQYSDTADFATTNGGERVVSRAELSALFDDSPTNLSAFVPDAEDILTLNYRLKVSDIVGNVGFSPVVEVKVPRTGRLVVASVTPPSGATNVSTEPVISVLLSNKSPFTVTELQSLIHVTPAIPRAITLSPDRRTITVNPAAPFSPGAAVTASVQTYPTAPNPPPNSFAWTFSVMASNQINRTLQTKIVDVPGTLSTIGQEGVGFLVVSNAGNVPARVTALPGSPSVAVVSATAATQPTVVAPASEFFIPVSLTVTGQYSGAVSLPITPVELSLGNLTTKTMIASLSSATSAPSLLVLSSNTLPDGFKVSFSGTATGNGTVSTLARVNGGAWWLVTQTTNWNFTASFSSDGDRLEIVASDADNHSSAIYSYTFSGPQLLLAQNPDFSLNWNAQLGRYYAIEWSTDLVNWNKLKGNLTGSGPAYSIADGNGLVIVRDAPVGRVSVAFATNHSAIKMNRAFFRVLSSTDYAGLVAAQPQAEVVLLISNTRGLSWDVVPGRVYQVEWSTNLMNWSLVSGASSNSGTAFTVYPGAIPLQFSNTLSTSISVNFATNHPAVGANRGFFRVKQGQ